MSLNVSKRRAAATDKIALRNVTVGTIVYPESGGEPWRVTGINLIRCGGDYSAPEKIILTGVTQGDPAPDGSVTLSNSFTRETSGFPGDEIISPGREIEQ